MRLLFVADRIPLELRAIVEFLNRQMRHTDVYAVELTQYRGGGDLRVLVPRVHGEAATAAKSPSGHRSTQRTTRTDTDTAIRDRLAAEEGRVATALLDHAAARGWLEGGTANYPSMSVSYPVVGRRVPVGTLSLNENPVRKEFSFAFGSIVHHLGREAASKFAERLPVVGGLDKQLAVQREKGFKAMADAALSWERYAGVAAGGCGGTERIANCGSSAPGRGRSRAYC